LKVYQLSMKVKNGLLT